MDRASIFAWDFGRWAIGWQMPGSFQSHPSAEFVGNVTRAQRALHAFVFSLVRHAADTDDVLQETNLVLWRKYGEFQPGTDFLAWAFRVAHFQVLAHRKRKQRAREHFDEDLLAQLAAEAEEQSADFEKRRRALASCLQKLPQEQRTLIARRYEPDGCVNDMAAERGSTPKAVSELLRRIRRTLQICIERSLAGEEPA
jgi:RNA polymerase sigma-70 factor (ECF subfamily)